MTGSFVYDAGRTHFGKYGKALSSVRPDDLAAHVISAIVERQPNLDAGRIDDIVFGNANGAGEDNRNVGRMGALLAGFPSSVPGTTVNRLCGSGVEAVIQGSRAVEAGDAQLVLTGGVESMSRAPWVVPKPDRAYPAGDATMVSTTLGWRLVNPRMPEQWTIPLGQTAEILAERFTISREEQDAFALRSHENAARAFATGAYAAEIIEVPGVDLQRDEGIRDDTNMAALARLKPAFVANGSVTAGNSSPLNDGASAVLIGAENALPGVQPLARIIGRGVAGNNPDVFGIAPVEAANRALARAGKTWSDVDLVEPRTPESITDQKIGARLFKARRTHRGQLHHLERQHVRVGRIVRRIDERVLRADVDAGTEQE
ncbi:thiolase family protein [Streptomyces solisilvae]|uniref:thiolase family protein n=1 Tax=Streptomyces malaysiensis TaxID=92644 RepID=UPI00368C8609